MKPPFDVTSGLLLLIASISEKIGQVHAHHLDRPPPEPRKMNRIKTIKASLEIEGNTLSEDQITAIIENKRVVGSKMDIREVVYAIEVYEKLHQLNPTSLKSFLNAHRLLMKGLIEAPGNWRTKGVGIFKGEQVSHIAPPATGLIT